MENDNGESLILESTDRGYLLSEVDLGDVAETDNTAKIPYIDGEQYGGMRLGSRDITVKGHCFNGDFARMERAFSPYSGVTLTLYRERTYYTIRGKPYGVCKCNRNPPYDFTVQFRCYDPFFYGEEVRTTFAQRVSLESNPTVLYNAGGAETSLITRFGMVIDRSLTKTDYTLVLSGTEKSIKLKDCPIKYGDIVMIDTTPGNVFVGLTDGTDLSQYLTWDSELFLLPSGRSVVLAYAHGTGGYYSQDGVVDPEFRFRPRYLVI